AVDYLSNLGMAAVAEHEAALAQRLVAGLGEIPGVEVLGPEPGRVRAGLASFTVEGVHPHDVAQYLDNYGIAIRSGHHCAQPLHRKLGIAASSRASLSIFSTEAEVEFLLDGLAGVRKYFRV
ncbi:MAG: aminotransferase class V-fold PLP-dependent enzyme, partial [Cryobacterium sp.]|nr:aminotransferase class V-fold PLP-dependent enzyme [Cryobacterium sp.]